MPLYGTRHDLISLRNSFKISDDSHHCHKLINSYGAPPDLDHSCYTKICMVFFNGTLNVRALALLALNLPLHHIDNLL